MAQERAFLGTCTVDDAPGSGTNDLAPHLISITPTWSRDPVQVAAKLSTDHRYQIPGVKFVTLSMQLGSLTTALKSIIYTDFSAGTLQRVVYRPLTGAKSATNPESTFDFYWVGSPSPPMNLTEEYVFEMPAVECVAAQWDDGTTTVTFGTLAT